jgi:hypothetical protein
MDRADICFTGVTGLGNEAEPVCIKGGQYS